MLHRFSSIFVFLLFIFWEMIPAEVNPDLVFKYLNLSYPGLENVKKAYTSKKFSEAKVELLHYFQDRTNRKFDWFQFGNNKTKADLNVKNVFHIKSLLHDFGDSLDWTVIREDKEWQFSLNKMKWFLNYVGVYQDTKDEKYVRAWMDQIKSWIELGDPGYPRTIDTGIRLQNWVISYWMFVCEFKSLSITPEFHAEMLFSMMEQAEFLYQPENWRRYSNWGTFENSGLSLFALMFPEFKRTDLWMKEIWFRMRFQLENSFHDDGMHIEVSPSYHGHELEVWFDFVRLAKMNGVESSFYSQIPLVPIRELFFPPVRALMHFYKHTGVVPQVGDTDERDERNFLFRLGEFFNLSDLMYVATDGEKGNPPDKTSVAFPDAGYYIMRSGWGKNDLRFNEELYLLFDCGTNYPWHAHYDMLNIVATAYGYDLLKDPGRFTYTDSKERDYFKSTAAHNTIVIDGFDQPRRYTPPKAQWYSLIGFDYVTGTQSSNPQVTHQRSVFFVKPEYWIIVDRLTGSGSHGCDQYWHLSDKALNKVEMNIDKRQVYAPHLLLFLLRDDAEIDIEDGWLAYSYRKKENAPVIRCSVQKEVPVVLPTVLYPFKNKKPEVECFIHEKIGDSSGIVLVEILSGNGKDFFFEQEKSGNAYRAEKIQTDARVVFVSVDDQERIAGFHIVEGSYLIYSDQRIAQIYGSNANVSVQGTRIEIAGDCVSGFELEVLGKPEVFLNGEKIGVEQKGDLIHYQNNKLRSLLKRD